MYTNFDEVIRRENTACVKYDLRKAVFGNDDILPMWVADMDFKAPAVVLDVMRSRLEHGIMGYPVIPDGFYELIVDWVRKRHSWNIKKEWILFTPGVVPSMVLSLLSFTLPGDKVIIQPPVYFPFFRAVENHGRIISGNKLVLIDDHYEIDFDDLESRMIDEGKMIFLCNPHNPVGRVWTQSELEKLAELCNKYDVLIVSDEIHSDIIFEGHRHIPVASLNPAISNRTITCMAPSKTFNLAGLAASFVIIEDEALRKKFKKLANDFHLDHGNIFGFEAMKAAYEKGEPWLNDLREYLQDNLNFVIRYFNEFIPGIGVIKPEGTYLAWLDFRRFKLSGNELNDFLIHKAKLGLSNGTHFGDGGEGFQRINFGCPRSVLKDGLDRLKNAVNHLNI